MNSQKYGILVSFVHIVSIFNFPNTSNKTIDMYEIIIFPDYMCYNFVRKFHILMMPLRLSLVAKLLLNVSVMMPNCCQCHWNMQNSKKIATNFTDPINKWMHKIILAMVGIVEPTCLLCLPSSHKIFLYIFPQCPHRKRNNLSRLGVIKWLTV